MASGYCLAGGFELLLCCDFRLVEEKTVIGFPESTIGLLPIAGGISRIGKAVPRPKALEILLNSANINLEELRNLGLINEIFHIEEMENTRMADYLHDLNLYGSGFKSRKLTRKRRNKIFI